MQVNQQFNKLLTNSFVALPFIVVVLCNLLFSVHFDTTHFVDAQGNCWSDVDATTGLQTWEWGWTVYTTSEARSMCDAVRAPLSSRWTTYGGRASAFVGVTFDSTNTSAVPVYDEGTPLPTTWATLVDNSTRNYLTNSACFVTGATKGVQVPCNVGNTVNTTYRVYCDRMANASDNHERWGFYPDPKVSRPIIAYAMISLLRTRAEAATYCAGIGGELAVFMNSTQAMRVITSMLNYTMGSSWERFQNARTECSSYPDRGVWTGLTSDASSFSYENSAQYNGFLGGTGQLPVNGVSPAAGACWATTLDTDNADVWATSVGCTSTHHFICSRPIVRAIATLAKSSLEQNQTTNATIRLSHAPPFTPLTLYFYTSNAGAVVSQLKSVTFNPGTTTLSTDIIIFAAGTGGIDTKISIVYDMVSRQFMGWREVAWNSSSSLSTSDAQIVGSGNADVSLNVSFAVQVNATPSSVTIINDQKVNITLTLDRPVAVTFQMAVTDVPACLIAAPGVTFAPGEMSKNLTLIASSSFTCSQVLEWQAIYVDPWSPTIRSAFVNVTVISKIYVKFLIVGNLAIYDAGFSTAGNATIRLNQNMPSPLPITVFSTNCTYFIQSFPATFTISNANPEVNITVYSRRLHTRVLYCLLSLQIAQSISFAIVDPLLIEVRQQAEIIPIYLPNIFVVLPEVIYYRIQTYWGTQNVTVNVDPLLSPYAVVQTPYAVMKPNAYARVSETIACTLPPITTSSPGGLIVSGPDAGMIAPLSLQRMLPPVYTSVLRSVSGDKYAIQLWATTYRLDPRGRVRTNVSLSIQWYNGNYPDNNKINIRTYDGCQFSDGTSSKVWKKSELTVGELLIWASADFIRVPGSVLNCTIIASRANSASDIVIYDNTLTYAYVPTDPQIGWTTTVNGTLPSVLPISTPYDAWVQVDRWPSGPDLTIDFKIVAVDPCIQVVAVSTTQMGMFEWNPIVVTVNGTCVNASCQRVRATVSAPLAQWPNKDVGFDGISAEWCVVFNRFLTLFITEVNGPSFLYAFSGTIQLKYSLQGLVGSDTLTFTPNASDSTFTSVGVIFTPASFTFTATTTSFFVNATMLGAVPPTIWFGWSNPTPSSNYDKTIRGSLFPSKIIFGNYITFSPSIVSMFRTKSITLRLAATGIQLPGPVLLQIVPTAGLTCVSSVTLTPGNSSVYITVTSDGTITGNLAVTAKVMNYTSVFSGSFVSCNVFVQDDSVIYIQHGDANVVQAPRYLWVNQTYPANITIQPRTLTDNLAVTMRQPYERPFYLEDQLTLARAWTSTGGAQLNVLFKGLNVPVRTYHRYEMAPLSTTSATYQNTSLSSATIQSRPKMTPSLIGPRNFFSGADGEVGAGATFYLIVGPPYTGAVKFDLVLTDIDSGQVLDASSIFANTTWVITSDYSGAPIPVQAFSWFARNLSLQVVPNVTTYHVNSTYSDARVFKRPSGTFSMTDTPSPDKTLTRTRSRTPPPTRSKTPTIDHTRSNSDSADRSVSTTVSVTPSISVTSAHTASPSLTPDETATITKSHTKSQSKSFTPDRSRSNSITPDDSTSVTISESETKTRSKRTPSLSLSKSADPTESVTPSADDSTTRTRSLTRSRTLTRTLSESSTATVIETPSVTADRTVSESPTPDRTQTGASPSKTRTITETHSISPARTDTGSFTPDKTQTVSSSDSKSASLTRSVSKTLTADDTSTRSLTEIPTPSRTPTRSKSISEAITRSFSLSKSETPSSRPTRSSSVTDSHSVTSKRTASNSLSYSDPLTRTKTFTRWSPTKQPTASRSATWTGGTATPTFHQWITCGEGWVLLGDFCYKSWPLGAHSVNESLPTPMTFDDSQTFCQRFGAHIIPIQNVAQMKFIQDLVGKNSGRLFWNGVYQDKRFFNPKQVWRTVFNRTHFNDFFVWDGRRKMPSVDDCTALHNYGDLSKRIVGGNGAMITYACDKRAEVVCVRRREPWAIIAVNQTTSGPVLAVEGQPLVLSLVGHRIPKGMQVQLQTTSYTTHSGMEGEPTQCVQTKPRNPIFFNVSVPAIATNVTPSYRFVPLCNGTCASTNVHFPSTLKLERGKKYSVCFYLPYHFAEPITSDEFRWNFVPDVWIEVAESRTNFLRETCQRRKELVELLYYDNTQTDAKRTVPTPYYFDGPIEPDNWQGVEGYRP